MVAERYQKYLEATPIERLSTKFEDEEDDIDEDHSKARSVITEMLLKAIPRELASEAITKRLEDPRKVLLLIMIKYQPGGRKEKEAILTQITHPEVQWNEDKVLEGVRNWKRRIERAKELKVVIPDPSVMLSALDSMTEKVVKKDSRRAFRLESMREQLKVDLLPTYENVESLTTLIEAELEDNLNLNPTGTPKVKTLNTNDERKGKGKDGTKGKKGEDPKGSKGKDESKDKGKKGKSEPCRYFSLEEGCRFGQQCKAYHRLLKPEEGKCYICGSTKHQAQECDRPKRDPSNRKGNPKGDGKKGKYNSPKGNEKGKPMVKPINVEEQASESSNTRELARNPSDPKEPETEPEKVIEAFQSMMIKALKERPSTQGERVEDLDTLIGSLKKKLDVNVKTIKITKCVDIRYGLLDSGATNNVREVEEEGEDLSSVIPIEVEVAFEGSVKAELYMNKEGTILGPKGTETIVSMSALIEELGYKVEWEEGACQVTKGEETLPVEIKSGTPMLPNNLCLKLIKEVEEKKRRKVMIVKYEAPEEKEEFTIGSIWPQLKELLLWLMKNNIQKGMELLQLCICRRRKEVESYEKRVKEQEDLMMNQIKDYESKKEKILVFEVCCNEDSKIAKKVREEQGNAIRVGLPNHNFEKTEVVEAILNIAEKMTTKGFKIIFWFSIPCSPWCSWQRVNLKVVPNFEENLQVKREEALKLVRSIKEVLKFKQAEAFFEWPKNNDGWKVDEIKETLKDLKFAAEIDGCAYNLKTPEGRPMRKQWRIVSNQSRIKDYLYKTCKGHPEDHAQVRGKSGKSTESYTDELVEDIVKCMMNVKELQVKNLKPMTQGELDKHQREGHYPYDSRCKDCLIAGIKDRPHLSKTDKRRKHSGS